MRARLFLIAISVAFFGSLGVLSLSDRAPGVTRFVLGIGRGIGSRVERRSGYDLFDRSDVPFAYDTIGHVVLWFGAAVLAWMLFHKRFSGLFIATALFAMSAGVEVAQGYLSSTRTPSVEDLLANGVGLIAGVMLGAAVTGIFEAFNRGVRSLAR